MVKYLKTLDYDLFTPSADILKLLKLTLDLEAGLHKGAHCKLFPKSVPQNNVCIQQTIEWIITWKLTYTVSRKQKLKFIKHIAAHVQFLSRSIQLLHIQGDLIWLDGPFKIYNSQYLSSKSHIAGSNAKKPLLFRYTVQIPLRIKMRQETYVNFPLHKCIRLIEIRLNKGGTTSSKPVLPEPSNGVYPFPLSLQICTSVPQSNTPSHCIDFADLFEQGFFQQEALFVPTRTLTCKSHMF